MTDPAPQATWPPLPEVIETDRLVLRPWALSDVDDVLRQSRIEAGDVIDEAWWAVLREEWEGRG